MAAARAQVHERDLAMQLLKEKRAKADSDVVLLKGDSVEASRNRAMCEQQGDHFKEYEVGLFSHCPPFLRCVSHVMFVHNNCHG